MKWRIDREAVLFLGAGRALLLQLAHPWVATAIAQHSQSLADPIGRFHRTFAVAFTQVFGTLDQALAVSRRLYRLHAGITGSLTEATGRFAAGSLYQANDIEALRWVYATLIDTAVLAYELVLPPLTREERERYWAEARTFAVLYGIPQTILPQEWEGFAAYNEAMWTSDTLGVSTAAQRIAQEIFGGAGTWLRAPPWYRALTARMLPERFRSPFGLDYGPNEQRGAERALAWIRRVYPLLPRRVRHVGPYQEAESRLKMRRPDVLTETANRFWIGRPRMPE